MALKITPKSSLDNMVKGEEVAYKLNLNPELDGNTVDTHTFKIYDDSDTDVTADFGGDSSESEGYITFGVKAHDTGVYALRFWVTCNELLPDGVTPYEFTAVMRVTIK
ncbi:MAG: hypothetical protein IMF10_09280 [Proteobacteria bacterium]|nr:hypothetical protein [Pseudomonadota bacterium]